MTDLTALFPGWMAPGWMALAFVAGAAAGWAFFASLIPVARMLAAAKPGAVGLQILRFIALALVLWLMTKGGAAVFLAGAAGVFAGRFALLQRAKP